MAVVWQGVVVIAIGPSTHETRSDSWGHQPRKQYWLSVNKRWYGSCKVLVLHLLHAGNDPLFIEWFWYAVGSWKILNVRLANTVMVWTFRGKPSRCMQTRYDNISVSILTPYQSHSVRKVNQLRFHIPIIQSPYMLLCHELSNIALPTTNHTFWSLKELARRQAITSTNADLWPIYRPVVWQELTVIKIGPMTLGIQTDSQGHQPRK